MKIGISGFTGRVGQLLVKEITSGAWEGVEMGAAFAKDIAGVNKDFIVTEDADELFEKSDVVIDFSSPEATRKNAWIAAKHHKPLIIGTTGLTENDEKELQDAGKETAIVYAANMSVGVNLLLALVEQAAARLGPEWDIEIVESHHNKKVDAPSGTALAIGKAARKGRNGGAFVTERNGLRQKGDIGYAVMRGGDVVGEHTLIFFGAGERIELGHKATDRALFARGAIRAAQWAKGKAPGLYSMRDVLGL